MARFKEGDTVRFVEERSHNRENECFGVILEVKNPVPSRTDYVVRYVTERSVTEDKLVGYRGDMVESIQGTLKTKKK